MLSVSRRCPVVQVALELPALRVGGRDEPRARETQPFELGAREACRRSCSIASRAAEAISCATPGRRADRGGARARRPPRPPATRLVATRSASLGRAAGWPSESIQPGSPSRLWSSSARGRREHPRAGLETARRVRRRGRPRAEPARSARAAPSRAPRRPRRPRARARPSRPPTARGPGSLDRKPRSRPCTAAARRAPARRQRSTGAATRLPAGRTVPAARRRAPRRQPSRYAEHQAELPELVPAVGIARDEEVIGRTVEASREWVSKTAAAASPSIPRLVA